MREKIKIAIMSIPMDRRPERAFAPKRLVEELLKNPEFEVYLIHYKSMPDEPLYKETNEILIPLLPLPWGAHFFSFIWFCLKTKEKFDIVHWLQPYVYPFFWLFPAKKVAVTVHDGYVGIWTLPNTLFWTTLTFFSRYVDMFIGVSENAKQAIMKTYHLSEKKVGTTYNGVDVVYSNTSLASSKEILKKYNIINEKYLLYVGSMHPHKNVERLVDAYILLRETVQTEEKLFLVGKASYGGEVFEKIKNTKYSKDILYVGFVSLNDLPAFYKMATSLVFVSLNEGCGMPIIEAMACGTPVITSNISAMPEIAGGAALLVDPYDIHDIMRGMKRMIDDKLLREDLVCKGQERVKIFTWENFVEENIGIYKKILNYK